MGGGANQRRESDEYFCSEVDSSPKFGKQEPAVVLRREFYEKYADLEI